MQEHLLEAARAFADVHDLHKQWGEMSAAFEWISKRLTCGDLVGHLIDRFGQRGVAERVAHDLERGENRNARRNQRAKRASETRDGNVTH